MFYGRHRGNCDIQGFIMKRQITLEQEMYVIGMISLLAGGPLLLLYLSKMDAGIYPSCIFYSYLGIYCPGCGGTRAVRELLHGHVLRSLLYHPLVLYAAAIYVVFMISQTLSLVSKGRIKGVSFHFWFLYGAVAVIAVNFIVKNLLKFLFGIILF